MKKIKPSGIDLHLKYLCPECHSCSWLSLKEAQTPNYIIVCDVCDTRFKIKTIDGFQINYVDKISKTKFVTKPQLDIDIKQKCIQTLKSYGFTEIEASGLIDDTFEIWQTSDISTLVKESLKLFGVKNG